MGPIRKATQDQTSWGVVVPCARGGDMLKNPVSLGLVWPRPGAIQG